MSSIVELRLGRALEWTLTTLRLWRLFKGLPGALLVMVSCAAALEAAFAGTPGGWPELPVGDVHTAILGLGALLGLLGYLGGDVWDIAVFDPLYSLSGRWLRRRRPLLVFPRGAELKKQRARATRHLPLRFVGENVYRRAERVLRSEPGYWTEANRPLTMSRFVRAFIWPSLAVSIGCIAGIAAVRVLSWSLDPDWLGQRAAAAFGLALVLFVVYAHLRVEHLTRLYAFALELAGVEPGEGADGGS